MQIASSTESSPVHLIAGVGQMLWKVSDTSSTTTAAASVVRRIRRARTSWSIFNLPKRGRTPFYLFTVPRKGVRPLFGWSLCRLCRTGCPFQPPQPERIDQERVAQDDEPCSGQPCTPGQLER